jgi:tetratricopeptide (TPR) repeat protein
MNEPSFKVFSRQAERLYERGVAAARGGQRTVAAGLLRQAVRLNPQHEQAWLWLGGVLDDPRDIAFCLRAALSINPENRRAELGLEQIEQRIASTTHEAASSQTPALQVPILPRVLPVAPSEQEPWWMTWRDARKTWRWTLRLVWAIPVLLIVTTLTVRAAIILQPLPTLPTYRDLEHARAATPAPPITPTAVPATPTAPALAIEPRVVTHYFQAVRDEQGRLQHAIQSYRKASERSRTTVERAAAARTLSDELNRGREALAKIEPPRGVETAHEAYLKGLALEGQALQDLLTFYGNLDVTAANRAALRLQNARKQIDDGKAGWDTFAANAKDDASPTPQPTAPLAD